MSKRITLNVNRLEMKREVGSTHYAHGTCIHHTTGLTEQATLRGSTH